MIDEEFDISEEGKQDLTREADIANDLKRKTKENSKEEEDEEEEEGMGLAKDDENNPYQLLFADGIHKLQDMKEKGKKQFKAFIGHVKKAPHFLIDNEYIKRGYRINFNSKKRICKSLFMCHNETVNVWSHLIGVGCFIGLLIYTIITLSPLASYFSSSSSVPDREISIN